MFDRDPIVYTGTRHFFLIDPVANANDRCESDCCAQPQVQEVPLVSIAAMQCIGMHIVTVTVAISKRYVSGL